MAKARARATARRNHVVLSEPVEVFLVGRVKHLASARLLEKARAKALKQRVKMSLPVEKPPGNNPMIVLSYVPVVVKKVTRPIYVPFLATTGNDNVKT